jgi:hypothetical protein
MSMSMVVLSLLIKRRFKPIASDSLGKKGKKFGIKLEIELKPMGRLGIDTDDLVNIFKDVGKGIDYDFRVEAELLL